VHGQDNTRRGNSIGLTTELLVEDLGPGRLRRAAAAERWWHDRGHSISGEDRGGAGQRVARAASLGLSGGVEMVGWLGDRTEGGARRRQQWGGRREL
jgi:hypothetical protein